MCKKRERKKIELALTILTVVGALQAAVKFIGEAAAAALALTHFVVVFALSRRCHYHRSGTSVGIAV